MALVQAAPPPEPSRGIAADGRVVTSPYGVPPPWGRDVMDLEKPHYPASLRATYPVATGFFRLIFDLRTGRVRRVIVERSSGYPDADANIGRSPPALAAQTEYMERVRSSSQYGRWHKTATHLTNL